MNRPDYEALDSQGLPYLRPSRVVGELPTPEQRIAALAEATPEIAKKIGVPAVGVVKFGTPVFRAFVMSTNTLDPRVSVFGSAKEEADDNAWLSAEVDKRATDIRPGIPHDQAGANLATLFSQLRPKADVIRLNNHIIK